MLLQTAHICKRYGRGWVGLGQRLMHEQDLRSRCPCLPDHKVEQLDCPVLRLSKPSTVVTHRSAAEWGTLSSHMYVCTRGWCTTCAGYCQALYPCGVGGFGKA